MKQIFQNIYPHNRHFYLYLECIIKINLYHIANDWRSWHKSTVNDSGKLAWESICRIFPLIQVNVSVERLKAATCSWWMALNNQKFKINLEPLFQGPVQGNLEIMCVGGGNHCFVLFFTMCFYFKLHLTFNIIVVSGVQHRS